MQNNIISVAVIGLGAFGQKTLRGLLAVPGVEVVAVADHDQQVAKQVGREFSVRDFDDTRQMILNAKPDVVFVATPPMHVPDILTACLKQKIHAWVEAPFSRSLGQGATFVRQFAEAGLKLGVGTQRRFTPSYQQAHSLRSKIGQIVMSRGHYVFNWGPNLTWRADKQSAGGGALLELGYHCIDMLTWMMGFPEEVYGVATVQQPTFADSQNPNHNTDDTAAAIFRFPDDAVATINTSRVSGPVSEEFVLRGVEGSVVANAESCVLRNPQGDIIENDQLGVAPIDIFTSQAREFISAVRSDAQYYQCSGAENLLNLAVIEAVYLSCQTCQPESPMRQLHIHGLKISDCLQFVKSASEQE